MGEISKKEKERRAKLGKVGQGTRFSKDNQPKNRGRKKGSISIKSVFEKVAMEEVPDDMIKGFLKHAMASSEDKDMLTLVVASMFHKASVKQDVAAATLIVKALGGLKNETNINVSLMEKPFAEWTREDRQQYLKEVLGLDTEEEVKSYFDDVVDVEFEETEEDEIARINRLQDEQLALKASEQKGNK